MSLRTRGAIEVAKVQGMGVVCFPSREEHGQNWHKRSECTNLSVSVPNSCRLQETCQCAVQRVDTMATGC